MNLGKKQRLQKFKFFFSENSWVPLSKIYRYIICDFISILSLPELPLNNSQNEQEPYGFQFQHIIAKTHDKTQIY